MTPDSFIALTFFVIALSIGGLFFLVYQKKNSQRGVSYPKFGDYSNLTFIGKGGMATIYRAKNKTLKCIVAIKMMDQSLMNDKDLATKFLKEGENLEKINDKFPNSPVVKALEYSLRQSPGPYFIAMEYLKGPNLLQIIKTGKRLPVKSQLHIIKEVARGLQAAHSLGIYHRDIAPDNIIVDGDHVTLIDFGIAKQEFSDYRTMNQDIVGKPFYMSPEHSAGKTVDDKTDIYSLGAVLFYLLEGRPMYDDKNLVAILKMHQEAPIPPINSPIPKDLKNFITLMLDKDSERRPNAGQVIEQIQYFLDRGDVN
ncbi:MAG: serine/threonine-protein kinase [Candidatus Omnitrophota bacterium]